MTNREQPGRLESHTIQPIGAEHRHGTARDLFTVWFGSNITLLALVTGALATTMYDLSFRWAVISILFGNLFGGVFMALHSAQGATLGVPQMVQTRGQFGSLGALLVVGIVIVMYVGFFASNSVLGGQALHLMMPGMTDTSGIFWIGALSVAAAILGHDLIHAYTRVLTYASVAVLALAFFWIVFIHGLPPDFMSRNSVSVPGVLSTVSIAALWQIAYAPYVSDYSRYMPIDTGARTAFWASYWGSTLGSIVPMILGAVVGIFSKNGDVIVSLAALTGGISSVVLIVFAVGLAAANAMNLYCCTLSTLTFGQTLVTAWSPKAIARAVVALILFGFSLMLALLTKGSFLVDYTDFILLLLYVLVPWTAINLVDYYLIQHGRYDVQSFMSPNGGIYGRVNVAAVSCYILGIAVQLPFMSTTVYTGFVAAALKGSDLSWIVGLAITAPIYYLSGTSQSRTHNDCQMMNGLMNSIEILERLVGFPTVSRDSNLDLIGFVSTYLASHGIESRLYTDPTGLKANLYASVGRPGAGGVLLSGHSDVVPVDGQKWSSDPFRLREEAGRLYARGVADMKGFLACAVAALARASQRSLRLPLQLAVSYDEEVGCVGVRSLIDDMEGWTDLPRLCIVGEPTLLRIAVGHKGKTALRATCHGLAAHSARPDRGQNAIYLGCDLVQMIRVRQAGIEATGPRDPGYEVPYTTLHVGTIHGGTALNIVPEHCGFELEIRNISADDVTLHIDGLREDARKIALEAGQHGPAAGIHIEVINEYPGLDTPQDSAIVDLVAGLTGERQCIKVGFGSEGGLFSQRLKIPTVVCGPGSIDQAHKPDEYLTTDQLSRCDRMMDALLEHLA